GCVPQKKPRCTPAPGRELGNQTKSVGLRCQQRTVPATVPCELCSTGHFHKKSRRPASRKPDPNACRWSVALDTFNQPPHTLLRSFHFMPAVSQAFLVSG